MKKVTSLTDKSNVGMYFATFALGTIREQSGNMGLAEKSYLQALKLKEKFLPEESAAPCYLGLCETAVGDAEPSDDLTKMCIKLK